jgi:Ca2+-binding RTX toxin-like protein
MATIRGTSKRDVLRDKNTSNTVLGLGGTDDLYGNGGNDTLKGGTGTDKLFGGLGNDKLLGEAGNDTLDGGAGNDTLDGGLGNDKMKGGAGNDTFVVNAAGDVTTDTSGIDLVKSSVTRTLGAGLENLTLTGSSSISGTGNILANIITGNGGANTLDGGDGGDTLSGGAGTDTLIGSAGNDILNGGTGADIMNGGADSDTYTVDDTNDVIIDPNTGGTAIDTVNSTAANFTLTSGAEIENLNYVGANTSATIFALSGNEFANTITGGTLASGFLAGNGGNDIIIGGNNLGIIASDVIAGGDGIDTLTGNGGIDYFVFGTPLAAETGDTITDFVSGTDHIGVFASGFGGGLVGNGFINGLALTAGQLVNGNTPDQANGQFLMHANGELWWDDDGTGANTAVLICTLTGISSLVLADITVT